MRSSSWDTATSPGVARRSSRKESKEENIDLSSRGWIRARKPSWRIPRRRCRRGMSGSEAEAELQGVGGVAGQVVVFQAEVHAEVEGHAREHFRVAGVGAREAGGGIRRAVAPYLTHAGVGRHRTEALGNRHVQVGGVVAQLVHAGEMRVAGAHADGGLGDAAVQDGVAQFRTVQADVGARYGAVLAADVE